MMLLLQVKMTEIVKTQPTAIQKNLPTVKKSRSLFLDLRILLTEITKTPQPLVAAFFCARKYRRRTGFRVQLLARNPIRTYYSLA